VAIKIHKIFVTAHLDMHWMPFVFHFMRSAEQVTEENKFSGDLRTTLNV